MLESAMRERVARASNFGARASNGSRQESVVAGPVALTPSVAGVAQLPTWEELMLKQPPITADLLRHAPHGSYFALQDRNSMAENWRDVFIVRDADEYVLFDEKGVLIDEASQMVPGGRQSVELLLEEYTSELKYYRAPEKTRLSPARQHGHREHNVENNDDVQVQVSQSNVCTAHSDSSASNSGDEASDVSAHHDTEPGVQLSDGVQPQQPSRSDRSDAHDDALRGEQSSGEPDSIDDAVDADGSISRADHTEDREPETEERPEVNRTYVSVGTRVSMREVDVEDGAVKWKGGMLAHQGLASLLVASDAGTWKTFPTASWGEEIRAEETPPADNTGVVAFAYDNANVHVTGMLMGSSEDGVVCGKMHAYCAHIARPLDETLTRLRGRDANARPGAQTFCLGDHVQKVNDPNSPTFAAVVRVLYSRRGVAQARRLLVLVELDRHLKLMCNSSKPPLFFPGSWLNWTRLESESTLSVEDIQYLDKVYCTFV